MTTKPAKPINLFDCATSQKVIGQENGLNLEQEFCEQMNKRLKLKVRDYSYNNEYNVAKQYIQKAMHRAF